MDRDALKRELTEQFQQSLDQAMDAVQRAPDGAWISASEWEVRELFQKLAEGWDIGSGPTEATCKTLTLRLKRPGMKWDRGNAAAMMNLVALRESGQWDAYWNRQSRIAA